MFAKRALTGNGPLSGDVEITSRISKKADMNTVKVRYMIDDADQELPFYTKHLGFKKRPRATSTVALLFQGNLELVLSIPFGRRGAKPMSDGRKEEPGYGNHT